ncbi:T9SS type A sorting domain-containing protein [Mesonia sp.]|uniref:T9SS type A sorting domain-containing protein n=1 Tax=Mesonia sp. TaxID=1960830 RepID=UPI0017745A7E|nr:T9SS type A sorting domain-containing protein [Mesonia sp.]HIB37107.1 T9SS type A sorting domain-containing protein [Mesonia sp.]
MKKITLLAAFFIAALTNASFAQTVTSGADDGTAGTLRQEILNANSGDVITIDDSVALITLTSEILIDKNLTIQGSTVSNTEISVSVESRIFNIVDVDDLQINNVNFLNGVADDGGALYIDNSEVAINDAIFSNNTADGDSGSGGAIYANQDSNLTISNAEFTGNTSNRAGGAIEINISDANTVSLININFNNNNSGVFPAVAAPGNGGALHVTGSADLNITDCTIINNSAAAEGGGLWNGAGAMTISNTLIDNNTAKGDEADQGGGGIYNLSGNLTINDNSIISNNSATGILGSGGGILNDVNGMMIVEDSQIISNSAQRAGGGIEDNSTVTTTIQLTNIELNENSVEDNPGNGGGLHITGNGNIAISGSTVNFNTAGSEGGGLWNGTGTMLLTSTTVSNNVAFGDDADQGGGGIFNAGGILTIEDESVISGNSASGMFGSGGGIFNDVDGNLDIDSSEVTFNSAQRAGGGIEDNSGNSTTIILTEVLIGNNTLSSNPGNGAGVHITGNGNINITEGTFTDNEAAAEGGGLWNGTGIANIDGTNFVLNIALGADADQGGGGIFNAGGTVNVIDAYFDRNTASGASGSGGAILNDLGVLTIENSLFEENSAIRAGGAIEENSTEDSFLSITSSNFYNNEAVGGPGNGGALHITGAGESLVSMSIFNENIASNQGGAIWNGSGIMTVDSLNANLNEAQGNIETNGGGGVIYNNAGLLIVQNESIFENNAANGVSGSGGAILNFNGVTQVENTTFDMNSANRAGGAIELIDGELSVENTEFVSNSALGTPNNAPGNGGAIHAGGESIVVVDNTIFNNNLSNNAGGALWNDETAVMNISISTVDSNISENLGGAIYNNSGELNILTSTISRNESTFSGGGIYNNNGEVFINRSTIAENTSGDHGGGIYNDGDLNMNAVTVAYNTATNNGGGIMSLVNVNTKNSIIAENTATSGNDASGIYTSQGYNLIGNDDEATYQTSTGDVVDASPNLGPLQNYGGPTETVALLIGSICVDSGDPVDLFKDQRDYSLSNSRDMGAFEYEGFLGVDDTQEIELSTLYPNPSTGQITIGIANSIASENIKLNVYSMAGNLVYQSSLRAGDNPIDLNNLNAGVYLLNIDSNNKSQSHKLIIN